MKRLSSVDNYIVYHTNVLSCVNICRMKLCLKQNELNFFLINIVIYNLSDKIIMILVSKTNLSYYPFVHLSIVEANSVRNRDQYQFFILWQFHVLHQVFMKWFLCILFGEKHLLCFENYNLTSILQVSISHKMYM